MSCQNCNDKHPIIWTSNAAIDYNHFTMSTAGDTISIPSVYTPATNLVSVQTCACECHAPVMKTKEEIQKKLDMIKAVSEVALPNDLKIMRETLEWCLGT